MRFGSTRMATLAAATGLLAGLAGPAHAADFCIKHWRVNEGVYFDMVGKGFRVPGRGRCKPFVGFSSSAQAPTIGDVTGSGCTSTDGSTLHFVLTEMDRTLGNVTFFRVSLPLPLGPNGDLVRRYTSGFAEHQFPTPEPCPTATMPIP